MIKPLKVRNIVLGEGVPKLIVPIVDKTHQGIIDKVRSFGSRKVDMIEWRMDHFEHVTDPEAVVSVLKDLRAELPDMPILATFRTKKEGGELAISMEAYTRLNRTVAESGYVDLVDVEIFSGDAVVRENIDAIHKAGVLVVASNHDFDKTPPKEELIARMCKMQEMGADLPKLAMMPNTPEDVSALLDATWEMHEKYADRPIFTMSMKGIGTISRLAGEVFGSCATFGSVGMSSAPGQVTIEDLSTVLNILHGAQERS